MQDDDVVKKAERKRYSVVGYIQNIDRVVLFGGFAWLLFISFLFFNGYIKDSKLYYGGVAVTLFVWYVDASKENTEGNIIVAEDIIRIIEERLGAINERLKRDVEVDIQPLFILNYKDGKPTRYEFLVIETNKNKVENQYTVQVDANAGYLVKIMERPSGWNPTTHTDVKIVDRYVSEADLAKLKYGDKS